MAEEGRLKMALEKFVEQTIPGIDYLAQYPGAIVSQNGQTFDFQPDSKDVPGIAGLSFYSGTPGVSITVDPTQRPRATLFFENGNPKSPALAFFANPGLVTFNLIASQSISLSAPKVNLGGTNPGDKLILGSTYRLAQYELDQKWIIWETALLAFMTAVSGGTPPLAAATAFLAAVASANLPAAIAAFDPSFAEYLSNVSGTY